MRYRQLGRTGLSVSEIGFGPEWMKVSPEDTRELAEALRHAGVNIMDCWMADPEIRDNLGYAIKGHADEWIIQGHIGACWKDGQYCRSRKRSDIQPAFEDELARLGVDHFDLGVMHYIDSVEEFDAAMAGEFFAYVQELKDAGTIRHIALSTHNPEVGIAAVKTGMVQAIMFSTNPAFDMMPASDGINTLFGDFGDAGENIDPVRDRFYRLCEAQGVGLTVMKPFAGGRLLSAEASPFGVGLTASQCIHYCLTRPAVSSVLCGYKTLDEVNDALAYEEADAEARDYASALAGAPAHAYFGQCTYCGHCQPCTVGIDIATVNKFADLAKMQDEVPASIREHYHALKANAEDCTACGACEPNCPFGVKIVERMAETAELFA
jgi:predicted aldo/keto reductase-like oxidoreductase